MNVNFSINQTIPIDPCILVLAMPQQPLQLPRISMWIILLVCSFFVLYLILSNRSTLIQIEFHVLATFVSFTLTSQLLIIIYYFTQLLYPCLQYTILAHIISLLFLILDVLTCSTLIYYSVYQFSILTRSKFILAVYNRVIRLKTFIIYLLSINIVIMIIDLFFLIRSFLDFEIYIKLLLINSSVPRFILISFYFSSAIQVAFSRLMKKSKIKNSAADEKRFRRNFRLMLKFMILPILYIVYFVPKLFIVFFKYDMNSRELFINLMDLLSDFFFFITPLLLIYVHNILKKKFLKFISKCFSCFCCCCRLMKKE